MNYTNKLFLLSIISILLSISAYGTRDYDWNGNTSDDWEDRANNWTEGGIDFDGSQYTVTGGNLNDPVITVDPGWTPADLYLSSSAVVVMNGPDDITIAGDLAISDGSTFTITDGELNIGGDLFIWDDGSSLTINGGDINVTGDIIFGRTGGGLSDGTNGATTMTIIDGTVICDNIIFDGTTNDSHTLSLSGGSASVFSGGDVENANGGDVVIDISDGFMDVSGDLLMNGGGDNLNMSGGQFVLDGDWENSGTTNISLGTVRFAGASPQSITQANSLSFYTLRIANTISNITLNDSIIVQFRLVFGSGNIVGNGNTVTFLDGSSYLNATDLSHINGPINKVGNEIFIFPTGDGIVYKPIRLNSTPNTVNDVYQAQYFGTNPDPLYPTANKEGGMPIVSILEYWKLDRLAGTSDEDVRLNWNLASDVGDLPSLVIARWDVTDNEWKNEGGTASGDVTSGFINSSAPLSEFGFFTFGSTTISNPLPVELSDFTVELMNNKVRVNWTTLSEINNNHFVVERFLDGETIEERAIISSKAENGNSTNSLNYSFEDVVDFNGIAYYRLKQVDHDGTFKEYDFKSVSVKQSRSITTPNSAIRIYPNPSSLKDFYVELEDYQNASFELYTIDFKLIPIEYTRLNSTKYRLQLKDSDINGVFILKSIDLANPSNNSFNKVILQ